MDGALQISHGFLCSILLPCHQRAQLSIGSCVFWIEFDGSSEVLLRKSEFARLFIGVTEVVVSFLVIRINLERFLKTLFYLIVPSLTIKCPTE